MLDIVSMPEQEEYSIAYDPYSKEEHRSAVVFTNNPNAQGLVGIVYTYRYRNPEDFDAKVKELMEFYKIKDVRTSSEQS